MREGEVFVSCVVPAYNEGAGIGRFLTELAATLARITPRYEIVVVDDGSRDDTLGIAVSLVDKLPLTVVQLSRNFGKEHALTAGIDHARGDVVVLIDADFQHPLAMIPSMVAKWREGYDMVYGIRDRAGESLVKRKLTSLFYWILVAGSKVEMIADAGDFRLLDRKVVDALKQLPERSRYMKGLFAWVGFRRVGIPFEVQPRAHGVSSFNYRHLSALAITGITAFSTFPLRIWSLVGALVALVALLYGLWIVYYTLVDGHSVPGWATLAAGMMFFGGVQLLSIGMLGEYVARIFEEVKGRPNYLVSGLYRRHDDDTPAR